MIELRDYQREIAARASEVLRQRGLCYLSMECRTGKTLTALETARLYEARRVLAVTKKKAIPSILADHALLGAGFSLDVVNYESAHKAAGEGCARPDFIILDEAHSLGAFPRPSQRAKTLREVCAGLPVLYLSGTPSPESYSQLYHQFWVSSFSPWSGYPNFYRWARRYVDIRERWINGHVVRDYSRADKALIDADTGGLFISRSQSEAGFDCKIAESVLTVPMSRRTAAMLATLHRDRVLQLDGGGAVLGDTPAKLMSKMHQISSGTVIDEDGVRHITDPSKAEFLKCRVAGRKLAVFHVFQSEADLLKEYFPDWTDSPEEFQRDGSKTFICQVRRAREGVRLDTADALVFFNMEFSYLSYEQGRNRLVSKERADGAEVYFLQSDCGIEADILEAVRSKSDFTASYYFRKHGKG